MTNSNCCYLRDLRNSTALTCWFLTIGATSRSLRPKPLFSLNWLLIAMSAKAYRSLLTSPSVSGIVFSPTRLWLSLLLTVLFIMPSSLNFKPRKLSPAGSNRPKPKLSGSSSATLLNKRSRSGISSVDCRFVGDKSPMENHDSVVSLSWWLITVAHQSQCESLYFLLNFTNLTHYVNRLSRHVVYPLDIWYQCPNLVSFTEVSDL